VNHTAEAHPASAHMFIVNPLSGFRMDSLFTTHPPTEERVRRLLAMAPPAPPRVGGWAEPRAAIYPPGSPWGGGRRNPWG
jgi:heat shock protein HtpX